MNTLVFCRSSGSTAFSGSDSISVSSLGCGTLGCGFGTGTGSTFGVIAGNGTFEREDNGVIGVACALTVS